MPVLTQVTAITPGDLSSDFVEGSEVTIVQASQTTAGKVRFCTQAELQTAVAGVALSPHDIQGILSGVVPALGGDLGIKVIVVNGVNTIESTLGDGSRTLLV